MNIDIVGRIRPPIPGEVKTNLIVTEGKRVHSEQGGTSHRLVSFRCVLKIKELFFTFTLLNLCINW